MVSRNILVVEDETIVALDIISMLNNFGYTSFMASSGVEAIKKVEEARPDLVFMDVRIQGEMDGIEAAEVIHTKFDTPVVFLTAYADEKTLQRAKMTEPFGYIVKPFEEKELYIGAEMAINKHEMEKKLKESERWLSATLKSIRDAVISTDDKGRVKFMNPFAEALTGKMQQEAVGEPLSEVFNIVSEDTGENVDEPIAKVMREGAFFGLAEHTLLIGRDGRKIPVEITGTPILDERDRTIGVVLVFYDISERKRIEKIIYGQR